jgi:membrane protein YdbS with pleckstrin-like domain
VTDEPDWLSVDPSTVVWRGGPRLRRVLPRVAVSLVGLVAAAGVVVLGVALFGAVSDLAAAGVVAAGVCVGLLALVPGGWAYRRTVETEYLITDEYAVRKTGVLGTRVVRVPLASVQSTSLSQDAMGSLFDYGTVTASTAGGDGAAVAFTDLDDPGPVRDRLRDAIAAAGGGASDPAPAGATGLPADAAATALAEWRAVREGADRLAREVEA